MKKQKREDVHRAILAADMAFLRFDATQEGRKQPSPIVENIRLQMKIVWEQFVFQVSIIFAYILFEVGIIWLLPSLAEWFFSLP